MLDGWKESEGVRAEIQIAAEFKKPVRYLAADSTGSPTSELGDAPERQTECQPEEMFRKESSGVSGTP